MESVPLFFHLCFIYCLSLASQCFLAHIPNSEYWLQFAIPRLLSSYEFILGPSQNSPAKELPFMVKTYEKPLAYKKNDVMVVALYIH